MDRMGREQDSLAHSMFLPHEIVASLHSYGPEFFERFLLGEPGVPDAEQRQLLPLFLLKLSSRFNWKF